MITDCYDIQSEPLLSLRDFYGEPGHKVEKCLILFSKHIHQHLLVNFDCEPIGTLNSCRPRLGAGRFSLLRSQLGNRREEIHHVRFLR